MNIALISNSGKLTSIKLYDECLKELASETFEDIYTLNFFFANDTKKIMERKKHY